MIVTQYKKCILVLSLWGLACCGFFFWRSRTSGSYITAIQQDPPHSQARTMSSLSLKRAVLGVRFKEAVSPAAASGSAGQKGGNNMSEAMTSSNTVTSSSARAPPNASSAAREETRAKAGDSSVNQTKLSPPSSPDSPPVVSAVELNATSPYEGKYPKLLCKHFTGRLGNELFEFASTLGLALSQNRTPIFLDSKYLKMALRNFTKHPQELKDPEVKERCKRSKHIHESSCCMFKTEMAKLDPRYDFSLGTYLQSYRYFLPHEAEIRKAVTFNDDIRAKANAIVNDLRHKFAGTTLIGMHIRHGDMVSDRNVKLGYPTADAGYMNRSMAFFLDLFPNNCTFVVASDSPDWVQENVASRKGSSVHFLAKDNDAAVDMAVLGSVDHIITSFGSYSWWAGFLNPGRTVYMKNFIKANTQIGKCFNSGGRDYVYPGWIPL